MNDIVDDKYDDLILIFPINKSKSVGDQISHDEDEISSISLTFPAADLFVIS